MKIDVLNVDKYVKEYNLKEVKTSATISYNSTVPNPDGLVSYEIFGQPGTKERKETYAYIDLHDWFVHPHVYYILTALARSYEDLIMGNEKFYVEDGAFVKYIEGKKLPPSTKIGTGIKFFYDNYEKINFSPKGSKGARKTRLQFMSSLKKEEVFISKWLVIPAYYRDVDVIKGGKNEINSMYSKLISATSMLNTTSGVFEIYETSGVHQKIQTTLNEIYNYFLLFVSGVKGFIHKHVMGKATDYAARLVISTPNIITDEPSKMEVSFHKSAIPLSKVLKCFAPFIVYGLRQYIENINSGNEFIWVYNNKTKSFDREKLASDWKRIISSEHIYKLIDIYDNSKEHRLDYFTVPLENGQEVPLVALVGESILSYADKRLIDENVKSNITVHPMTLTELFYIIAEDYVSDKHVLITRYPIEDYHNIYPSGINIIPSQKMVKKVINGVEYPRYPDLSGITIDNANQAFTDTLRLFPTYLKALGADFDGDMCSLQGIMSEEANAEAERYIHSITNIVNIAGETMRTTGDVTAHTIFGLTAGPEF